MKKYDRKSWRIILTSSVLLALNSTNDSVFVNAEEARELEEINLNEVNTDISTKDKFLSNLNYENNLLTGVILPEQNLEIWMDGKLIEKLIPDLAGNFYLEIELENELSTFNFVIVEENGRKNEAISYLLDLREYDSNNTDGINEDEKKMNDDTSDVTNKNNFIDSEEIDDNEVNKESNSTTSQFEVNKEGINSQQFSMNISIQDVKGKTYYYIKSGDTLTKISEIYKVSISQLLNWNPHIKNEDSIRVGDLISIDGRNVYSEIDKEGKVFNGTQSDFINHIAPVAQELSAKHGLYASVMIAQAAHESAWGTSRLATIGNNLSGIKGSYNGNSIVMLTWEEKNGEVVWIEDRFRLYPSYREALLDYVDKLVNGLSYSPDFYKGTWVKNTASHFDATEWLTGRYATDSQYNTKLNATIRANNLTRFDTHIPITDPIISQRYVNYVGIVTNGNANIYSEPNGTASSNLLQSSSSLIGQQVTVQQEKVNNAGVWSKIYSGNTFIGWILKNSLDIEKVTSTRDVQYTAQIVTTNHSIDSLPYGVEGFSKVGMSGDYLNQNVVVTQEKTTRRGTFAKISINSKSLGWVDNRALNMETVLSERAIKYAARIVTTNNSIDTQPYGIEGFKKIGMSSDYYNQNVIITHEKVTPRGTIAYITINGKEIGWIDTRALRPETVTATRNTSYAAKVVTTNNSIDSQPYGIEGFNKIGSSSDIYNQKIVVSQEKVTPRGTFAYISLYGKELGWVDKRALVPEVLLYSKDITYAAKVVTKNNTIDSQPYGIEGFEKIGTSSDYFNQNVIATQEKTTPRGTFVYITQNNKGIGWVDKVALEPEIVLSTRTISYAAKVVTKTNSIDTHPYGVEGFKKLGTSSDYFGQNVIATQEKVTPRGTFVYITQNNKGIGWVDKVALEPETVLSTRTISYAAKVVTKTNSIDTHPYGIEGFKKVGTSGDYYKQNVIITQETRTSRGTFVYITQNNKGIGWVDSRALEQESVLSERNVSYAAKIISKNNSIDTEPYGIDGFMKVGISLDYLNKNVVATKEIVTQRGTFLFISLYGKPLGWIDSRALEKEIVLSEKQTNYQAIIVGTNNTIDTLPYGLDGFQTVARTTDNGYINKLVKVSKEVQTTRGTFALIVIDSKELGWIDVKALTRK